MISSQLQKIECMKIGFYIGALLYRHDCVVIPGFGGFIANYTPAFIHPVQNTFNPPSRQIMFNASLLHNDGLLATHIAGEEGISFDQALNRIIEEVVAIHNELKSGKTIQLDGLGSLRSNHENSIVFTPKSANNWLEDAYGLSTFVSPPIRRSDYHSNQDSQVKRHGIHLPIAVRRIAAIAVPLLAIGLWSLFNADRITAFTSNYSSVFPSEILSQFSLSSIKKSIPVYVLSHSKSSTVKTDAIHVSTTKDVIAEPVVTTENSENNTAPIVESKSVGSGHFYVIGGAFKSKENADKMIEQLKAKNFSATIAGQNKKGLYLVSAASCDDASQATLKLQEVLEKGIKAAWILKNKDL
jgi:hypothetical protein